MAFVKIETSVARNRKFVKAGPAPSWLWLCGLLYCQEGLTDGFIPTEALGYLGVKNPRQLASHLVTAGLWHVTEGGWQVNDYLAHNKSAAEVRRVQGVRHDAGAEGGKRSGEERRKQNTPVSIDRRGSEVEANPKQVAEANPKQTSNPESESESEADQKQKRTEHTARPQPIVARRNLNAAWEGPRGLYVLEKQHQQFVASQNGAVALVFAFYQEVGELWGYGAMKDANIDPDMPKFWNARYAEKWPPAKATAAPQRRWPNWKPTGTDGLTR
jgi:hypothetical protein